LPYQQKILSKVPRRGPKGFYLLLILLANAKAGTDSHTRMFHKPAIEDAEPVIEHPPPPPPVAIPIPPLEPLPLLVPEPLPPPDPKPLPPLAVKLAEHVLLAFMFVLHVVLVPQLEQSPLHPAKV
jgi:hypothetical protein